MNTVTNVDTHFSIKTFKVTGEKIDNVKMCVDV